MFPKLEVANMWGNEDFEEDPLDNSCYLAVDFASNIVAKGTILMDTCEGEETIEVMMEVALQGETSLPIPLKEEYIEKVKEAIGHILSWSRHLVMRCSDMEKVVAKPKRKPAEENKKETESKNEKKRPREPAKENKKLIEKEPGEKRENKKEIKGKIERSEEKAKENVGKKMTRAQRNQRVRMERSGVLTMSAHLVNSALLSKEDSKRLRCEYDLFGHDSYMYLIWEDFEAVFTFTELTRAAITSYIICLYEQIKKEQIRDRGICFMNPSAISRPDQRKSKQKHIEDASRAVADRLYKRKGNDIILLSYNPGNHWLLAVLNLKTTTCYYLDSLRPSSVDEQLRQIIDTAMAVYAERSGTKTRVKLTWINFRCPHQPGGTECGYYVMKFMKEIA